MSEEKAKQSFNAAELGALAHLYRGELYRSKVWRTRLDATTNWSVATTGLALSMSFSSADNSPLPLLVVIMLVLVFLVIEARRYRYFDMWRTRVRIMELFFYGPILLGKGPNTDNGWNEVLHRDYRELRFHISFWEAFGRRLRRNYFWIFFILGISYLLKIMIHPTALSAASEIWSRAAIGPIGGQFVVWGLMLFFAALAAIAVLSARRAEASGRVGSADRKRDDPVVKLARSAES